MRYKVTTQVFIFSKDLTCVIFCEYYTLEALHRPDRPNTMANRSVEVESLKPPSLMHRQNLTGLHAATTQNTSMLITTANLNGRSHSVIPYGKAPLRYV